MVNHAILLASSLLVARRSYVHWSIDGYTGYWGHNSCMILDGYSQVEAHPKYHEMIACTSHLSPINLSLLSHTSIFTFPHLSKVVLRTKFKGNHR